MVCGPEAITAMTRHCAPSMQAIVSSIVPIDLFLLHWPVPHRRRHSRRALERILGEGRCRAIGVSNFMVHHLEELLGHAKVPRAMNQIELHPGASNVMSSPSAMRIRSRSSTI